MTTRTLFLLLGLTTSLAQPFSNPVATITQDVKHAIRCGTAVVQAPLHFSNQQWLTTAGVLGITSAFFAVDKDIRKFSLEHRHRCFDRIFQIDEVYGKGYTVLFTGGLYGLGLAFNKPDLRMTGLRATEALVFASMITGAGKIVIGRRRPNAGESQLVFKPMRWNYRYQSLPSGHTTAAFAVSTVLANSLDNTGWKVFCYGAAGAVGAARIYHNRHWWSDVLLGAALGHVVALKVMSIDSAPKADKKCRLTPFVSPFGMGLAVIY